jgi:dephospho-CoA kinase
LPEGSLDRAKLRELIFQDEAQKSWLNNLLHPLIRERMIAQIDAANSDYCILAVPLLLENKMQAMVNRVLVVDVLPEEQIKRVTKRDNSSEALVRSIMSAQMERDARLRLADDIIDNQSSIESLDSQVKQLHEKYLSLANE